MITSSIGEFPLYIYEHKEEITDDIEFMSYQVLVKPSDKGYTYRAFCQGIPCGYCDLHPDCSTGKEQTHIVKHVRDNFPELYV